MSELLLREAEARNILRGWCPGTNPILADENYTLVKDEEAAKVAGKVHATTSEVLRTWSLDRADCDKFSVLGMVVMQVSHALHSSAQAGIAFGFLHYRRTSDKTRHSINVMLTRVAGEQRINVRCFDPQTGEEVVLTAAEIRSITTIYM